MEKCDLAGLLGLASAGWQYQLTIAHFHAIDSIVARLGFEFKRSTPNFHQDGHEPVVQHSVMLIKEIPLSWEEDKQKAAGGAAGAGGIHQNCVLQFQVLASLPLHQYASLSTCLCMHKYSCTLHLHSRCCLRLILASTNSN